MEDLTLGGNRMKKVILPVLGILVLFSSVLPAFAQEENLSAGRTLGLGIQADFPWGGLVSARYWLVPQVGIEAVAFAWGNLQELSGTLTGRLLFRVADTPAVDFYLAAGGTFPFSPYGGDAMTISAMAGIEFSFPFAKSLAWNIEFGGALETTGDLAMAIGTGIHFYF
jgi:hypothetical protein